MGKNTMEGVHQTRDKSKNGPVIPFICKCQGKEKKKRVLGYYLWLASRITGSSPGLIEVLF